MTPAARRMIGFLLYSDWREASDADVERYQRDGGEAAARYLARQREPGGYVGQMRERRTGRWYPSASGELVIWEPDRDGD